MIEITIDTREQTPLHFAPEVAKTKRGTIRTGDYAITGDAGFSVERKSLDDFLGTISTGWERFQRELYRAKDAGFPSFPIVVEARFTDVIFSCEKNGEITPPNHDHIKLTPAFVLKRIGEIAQMGGVVVFADGRAEATMLTFSYLSNRDKVLNKDDADEHKPYKNHRKS